MSLGASVAVVLAILTGGALLSCSDGSGGEPGDAGGGESVGGESVQGGAGGADGADGTAARPGDGGNAGAGAAGAPPREHPSDAPYASEVVSFTPGDSAGFNADKLPGVVLGPPRGLGTNSGSLDVVSLGVGGEIVVAFGAGGIVDGEGPDFVVFENAFWPSGDQTAVFAELGEISVSEDGEEWHTFECDAAGAGEGTFPGCAGWTPTLRYDAAALVPLDAELTGGDAFDLADVGLARARFVKIRDLATQPPGGDSAGFDLDAVGIIHAD